MNGENYKLRCKKCDEKYAERSYAKYEWYIPCQTNFLKEIQIGPVEIK